MYPYNHYVFSQQILYFWLNYFRQCKFKSKLSLLLFSKHDYMELCSKQHSLYSQVFDKFYLDLLTFKLILNEEELEKVFPLCFVSLIYSFFSSYFQLVYLWPLFASTLH